jgi:hypothetical protein
MYELIDAKISRATITFRRPKNKNTLVKQEQLDQVKHMGKGGGRSWAQQSTISWNQVLKNFISSFVNAQGGSLSTF